MSFHFGTTDFQSYSLCYCSSSSIYQMIYIVSYYLISQFAVLNPILSLADFCPASLRPFSPLKSHSSKRRHQDRNTEIRMLIGPIPLRRATRMSLLDACIRSAIYSRRRRYITKLLLAKSKTITTILSKSPTKQPHRVCTYPTKKR